MERTRLKIRTKGAGSLDKSGLPGMGCREGAKISSQGRYDHFDTPPGVFPQIGLPEFGVQESLKTLNSISNQQGIVKCIIAARSKGHPRSSANHDALFIRQAIVGKISVLQGNPFAEKHAEGVGRLAMPQSLQAFELRRIHEQAQVGVFA